MESSARQDGPKAAAVQGRISVDLWELRVQSLLCFGLVPGNLRDSSTEQFGYSGPFIL